MTPIHRQRPKFRGCGSEKTDGFHQITEGQYNRGNCFRCSKTGIHKILPIHNPKIRKSSGSDAAERSKYDLSGETAQSFAHRPGRPGIRLGPSPPSLHTGRPGRSPRGSDRFIPFDRRYLFEVTYRQPAENTITKKDKGSRTGRSGHRRSHSGTALKRSHILAAK